MSDLKLSSHHITKLIEFIEDDQYVYLISSWMNRRDICCFMKRHHLPYLSEEEFRKPLKNIISALKTVHQAGFLHNDVQPCNILIEKKKGQQSFKTKLGGFSKVLPVGLASIVQETQVNLYRAPEVLTDNYRTTASDVWSLGVTLFVIATGRFPFKSRHAISN